MHKIKLLVFCFTVFLICCGCIQSHLSIPLGKLHNNNVNNDINPDTSSCLSNNDDVFIGVDSTQCEYRDTPCDVFRIQSPLQACHVVKSNAGHIYWEHFRSSDLSKELQIAPMSSSVLYYRWNQEKMNLCARVEENFNQEFYRVEEVIPKPCFDYSVCGGIMVFDSDNPFEVEQQEHAFRNMNEVVLYDNAYKDRRFCYISEKKCPSHMEVRKNDEWQLYEEYQYDAWDRLIEIAVHNVQTTKTIRFFMMMLIG